MLLDELSSNQENNLRKRSTIILFDKIKLSRCQRKIHYKLVPDKGSNTLNLSQNPS